MLAQGLVLFTSLVAAVSASTGRGTAYYQYGVAGSCGQVHSDSDLIAAIANGKSYCGKQIRAKNTGSNDGVGGLGNELTVTVADTCPSCGAGDVDFSIGAWNQLTNNSPLGTFNVEWEFIN
ncbi:hypothetical protein VTN96DRAFT_5799 [Rasamsonia emersonii]|uniref:Mrsp1 n=1 Tax=Rasamsonia emersonii (strain ATCC 16479 / CBS 393.64 / IMI 116815) TaxID=1408163 RepID=A0A0F4Z1R0_RASE3|nr:Mrsp1 [Rasamsonia emersonii CBS 393.64]KKA23798.1 Mrsp1 [Rasamsonia emersonii CBS 393.64]